MPRYAEVTILLRARILALIEDHPEILTMPPGDLFQIREFEFEDINPTREQAYDALAAARRIWNAQHMETRAPRLDVMEEICRRIVPLIHSHPEILKMTPSAVLLSFPELFLDLKPTLREVVLAVETAIEAWETLRKDLEKP